MLRSVFSVYVLHILFPPPNSRSAPSSQSTTSRGNNSATKRTGSEKRKSREKMKWKTATLPVLCDGNDEVESCGVRADKINTFSVYSASRTRFTSLSHYAALKISPSFWKQCQSIEHGNGNPVYVVHIHYRVDIVACTEQSSKKHTTMSVLCFMYIFFFCTILLLLYSPSSSSSFTPSSRGCLKRGGGGRRSGALLV